MTDLDHDHDAPPADTETLLRQLFEMVENARNLPMSTSVRIERDEVLDLIEEAVNRLPEELRAARWLLKEREERAASHIPEGDAVLFLEVTVRDASEFNPSLVVHGHRIGGYRILRTEGAAIPNAIAAVLLEIRDRTQKQPHIYFGWTEGNPLKYLARFVLFGEGDVAPVTHEILRKAEPFARRRPAIHVG